MKCFALVGASALLVFLVSIVVGVQLDEAHRVAEHRKRYGEDWPPPYIPETLGWKKVMDARFQQIREMDSADRDAKYDAWMETVNMAIVAPNFTEYGFGLARAPDQLTATLQREIRSAIQERNTRNEEDLLMIGGPNRCQFIDRPDLTDHIAAELQRFAEAWVGLPLKQANVYGFRVYQNMSDLNMHIDVVQTHIISIIFHIDRSEDSQPWPLLIEDFHGRTHEIELQPGDILFYESSKCLHGRPKPFFGSWYTSVFVHYYPRIGWMDIDRHLECHYAIPPDWDKHIPSEQRVHTPLDFPGYSFKERQCPYGWCNSLDTIKWTANSEKGYWIDADHRKHPFAPAPVDGDVRTNTDSLCPAEDSCLRSESSVPVATGTNGFS